MSAYLETRYYPMDFPIHAFYASDNCYLAHWHIDVEMVYVCEGSIRIGINKDVKILKKGEFAVFRSTDIHYYDSTNLSSKIIVLIFRPEIIEASSGWPEKLRFDSPFMV
ncbi:MAG: cupin domain-containing protein, partial [Bacillota bacterium]|nr:cupin domain-containing protein [Bacillota bacterium]